MSAPWFLRPLIAVALIACMQSAAQDANRVRFRIETVKSGLERPWSLNFAPDGRLLFTNRYSGRVSALNVNTGELSHFSGLPAVRAQGEGGLMGMALDPNFAANGRVYLCYSYFANDNPRNRLSSFVLAGTRLGNERVLIDDMPGAGNHNGCRVIFGPDGYLYASMGDAAQAELAQNLQSKAGKIFRIASDGSIPADNPFPGNPVWTLGHRNAQGLAFQPGTNAFWSTEHGPTTRDELNVIKKGRNYGWPNCLGTEPCELRNYEPAVKTYTESGTVAMSDMTFYEGRAFPAWRGHLFFVTLKTGRLYRLELNGERVRNEQILIDGDFGRLRDVTVGPDGFLYVSTDAGQESRVLRIRPD